MSKGVIKIGKPYVTKIKETGKARLCSNVQYKDEKKTLYFEVDEKNADYLCVDRCDAFLVGLLHTAMYENMNICCDDVVSQRLLFQLTTYYIPIISDNLDDMNQIEISAVGTAKKVESANAVVTGLSGGADSFYTLLKYTKENMGSYGLTHGIFNNIVSADINDERIRIQHNKDVEDKKRIADELGIEFVELYSNLFQFYSFPGIFNHYFTMQYMSAAFALAGLFGVFYFSSSYTLKSFSLNYKKIPSGAPFDLFTLNCVTTDTLSFYSAGMEVERYNKMEFFAKSPIVQKNLHVCGALNDLGGPKDIKKLNCGTCMKCSRAIVTLELLGELEKYDSVIDTTLYRKNKKKFIGRYLAGDKGVFAVDVLRELRRKKKYTLAVRFWRRMFGIRFKLAKNKALVALVNKIKG